MVFKPFSRKASRGIFKRLNITPFLSIVIIFCDKDFKYIESLCKTIELNILVNHEIILISNCEKYKDVKFNIPECAKIYTKGYNAKQFESRRYSIQFCSGKYIWFVDADDTVLKVKCDIEKEVKNSDVIIFSSLISYNGYIGIGNNYKALKFLLNGNKTLVTTWQDIVRKYPDIYIMDPCAYELWNKWIKTELAKKCIQKIPENKEIVASEDIFFGSLFISNSKSLCLTHRLFYEYSQDNSTCGKINPDINRFKHIITGYKEVRTMFKTYIKSDYEWNNIKDNAAFFLIRAYNSPDRKLCFEELLRHFDKKELLDALNHNWVKNSFDKEGINNIKTFLGMTE